MFNNDVGMCLLVCVHDLLRHLSSAVSAVCVMKVYSIFISYSIIVAFFAQIVLHVIVTDGRCVYTYLDINVHITVANVCTFMI